MTQQQRDCVKMIVALLLACAVVDYFAEPFVEHGRLVAIEHGCHSPRCIEWKWWFE